jgi:ABC-type nitrate/sulfonate/bicarbonate transport system substrate-binding protein
MHVHPRADARYTVGCSGEVDMFIRAILVTGAVLAALPAPLMAADPTPQGKGLETIRFITFSLRTEGALVAGRARGFFAAEGLNVEITMTPNSTVQMRGIGEGTWEVASTAFDNVLAWSGRDGGPQIVGVLQRSGRVDLPVYVRPEIGDWADLRGRPLAADAVDTAFALVLRRVLLAHGLDMDRGDYELVAAGNTPARFESMRRGETFAAILNAELAGPAREAGFVQIADYMEVLPDYPQGVYAVSRAWAERHPDQLVRFLRAWVAAARWARDNPRATVELLVAEGVPQDVAEQGVADTSPDGTINLAGLESVLGLRTQFGFTPPMGADLSRYVDPTYYQRAAAGR